MEDTVRVVAAIPGGPAEGVGVQAGDKIVLVDGKNIAGIKIANKGVMEKLKGQNVVPTKLIEAGYKFQYPTLKLALENLLK